MIEILLIQFYATEPNLHGYLFVVNICEYEYGYTICQMIWAHDKIVFDTLLILFVFFLLSVFGSHLF